MSIDPSLPSDEPSDEASNHADKNRALWDTVRDLAEPMREAFRELKSNSAAEPRIGSAVFGGPLEPGDWIDVINELMTADFTGCWDADAAAWDKQATDNARQAAAELREGR